MRSSICMAAYNGEEYLKEQITSILSQMNENDEIVVSDNGSLDSTLKILESFDDKRIKVIHCEEKGVTKNFESALRKSSGEYIFLCDQDDIWLPGRINKGIKLLQNSDLASVSLELIDASGEPIHQQSIHPNGGFISTLLRNSYPGCALCMRRKVLEWVLPFPKSIPMHDWWIVLFCMIFGKVQACDSVYIQYRRHANNVSNTGSASNSTFFTRVKWRVALLKAIAFRFFICIFNFIVKKYFLNKF